jgi:hypothetical protein
MPKQRRGIHLIAELAQVAIWNGRSGPAWAGALLHFGDLRPRHASDVEQPLPQSLPESGVKSISG